MAWNGLNLTVNGRNALSHAQVSGEMSIKSIVIGDGNAPDNFNTQQGLKNYFKFILTVGMIWKPEESVCLIGGLMQFLTQFEHCSLRSGSYLGTITAFQYIRIFKPSMTLLLACSR